SGSATEAVVQRSNGGLVTAISSFLSDASIDIASYDQAFWVGVPGCSTKLWEQVEPQLDRDDYTYLPVFTNTRAYQSYYSGFSNSVLWPLFHYFPSYAEYDAENFDNYLSVNGNFL